MLVDLVKSCGHHCKAEVDHSGPVTRGVVKLLLDTHAILWFFDNNSYHSTAYGNYFGDSRAVL